MTAIRTSVFVLASVGMLGTAYAAERLPRIPQTFSEVAEPLSMEGESKDVVSLDGESNSIWRKAYDTNRSSSSAWIVPLASEGLAAERVDLWVEGDGSGNSLVISAYYKPDEKWLEQATIPIDFRGWRHLVIPAGNPIHAFHREVPRIRITIKHRKNAKAQQGSICFRGAKLVRTTAVLGELPDGRPPAPIFDTWGGPPMPQLAKSKQVGVDMHLIPVDFPKGHSPAARSRYAAQAIPVAKKAGLLVGLAFFPTPPPEWLAANQELLCRNANESYDRPGGAFLSPWNPQANELWRIHIREVLEHLRREHLLESIDVIELCPGEEGEVSFEWNHVWAFDKHAVAAYREFLKRQYHDDITALNRDWATSYESFDMINPPSHHYPDREHWVFTEFYRFSMLRRCALMADAVSSVFEPRYWLWMCHSIGNTSQRFFSARYPAYYTENLRRLGCADFIHLAALEWQTPEDVRQIQQTGARVLAEVDVVPSAQRLEWTFQQAERFGCDGVFIGVLEGSVDEANGGLTERGRLVRSLVESYRLKVLTQIK